MRVDLRTLAAVDVDAAVNHYREEAGSQAALDFVDALEAAISHLRHYPNSGSRRLAFELEIPELLSWSLQRFPYLIFYVPLEDRIDIWRVLHARRDIPTHLTAEPPA